MNSLNPKISVITASYNYADLIIETIESVINQNYQNWEMIIVDDGSADNSREVIQKYCDNNGKIKLFTHQDAQNKGLCETVKLGCEIAQGEYIAFLESDDVWTPNHLEEKVKVIQKNPDIALIFNAVELFGDMGPQKNLDEYFKFQKHFLEKQSYPANIFKYFLFLNIIPTFSCVMLKKDTLCQLDFNAPYAPHLDWFLWMQIVYKEEVFYLDKALTKWRIHLSSFIQRTKKEKRNNNKIIYETIKLTVLNSKLPRKSIVNSFLINYYSLIMILIKMHKKMVKKFLHKISSQ